MHTLKADIQKINTHSIIKIPSKISQTFPSRGMVMGKITVHNVSKILPFEPDGYGSHWFYTTDFPEIIHINDTIIVEIVDEWPNPTVPEDLLNQIQSASLDSFWNQLTQKAKWQWLRWIRSTKSTETRNKRIQTTIDMLSSGKKRPCCFNQNQCTDTKVSKSGKLL